MCTADFNDYLLEKELFIGFTVRIVRGHLSINSVSISLFGFEDGIWDLIVLVPDHCHSIYFIGLYLYTIIKMLFRFVYFTFFGGRGGGVKLSLLHDCG